MMNDIVSQLTDKNDQAAYANTKRIAAESAFSDRHYACLPVFAQLLSHQKSYVRTRAFILCCSQARWDTKEELSTLMPEMMNLLHDCKPTVVRQCLNALKEVSVFRPELNDAIRAELGTIDLSVYKDSMRPLIRKDIDELLSIME